MICALSTYYLLSGSFNSSGITTSAKIAPPSPLLLLPTRTFLRALFAPTMSSRANYAFKRRSGPPHRQYISAETPMVCFHGDGERTMLPPSPRCSTRSRQGILPRRPPWCISMATGNGATLLPSTPNTTFLVFRANLARRAQSAC